MYTNKAQLLSMNTQLTEQLAMVRVAGTLSKSTEVMTLVNNLVKVRSLESCMQRNLPFGARMVCVSLGKPSR